MRRRQTRTPGGEERWSVELELEVQGGTPARVPLGRRHAAGFTPMPPEAGKIAFVESYIDAHGEYAEVTRPRPGELIVEAFGQDEGLYQYVPPRTNVRRAVVRIPADAGVEVAQSVDDDDDSNVRDR
jgi:hypothetical protein